ncbi:hypothetical protein MMC17_006499 [Xylographa soralifera]|nr:hypothetical protein [Xylographa soralifera]
MPSLTSHTVYNDPVPKPLLKSSTTSKACEATGLLNIQQQAPLRSPAEAVAYLDAAISRVDVQLARLVENVVGTMEVWQSYAFGGEESEESEEEAEKDGGC